jgi:hypothetical protein
MSTCTYGSIYVASKIFRYLSAVSSSTTGTNMGANIKSRTGKNRGEE